MTYVIAEPCIGVKDSSCVEACPGGVSGAPSRRLAVVREEER